MIYTTDPAAEKAGIETLEVRDGCARTRMTVGKDHLNGHNTVHGGIVFMLADAAFAYACNSRGVQSMGIRCDIDYHRPAYENDVLTAVCEENFLEGRKGIYEVIVTNQNDETVAHFRGYSMALKI